MNENSMFEYFKESYRTDILALRLAQKDSTEDRELRRSLAKTSNTCAAVLGFDAADELGRLYPL